MKFIAGELEEILRLGVKVFLWILRELTESFRTRVRVSNELSRNIRKAKKSGKKEYFKAIINFAGSFFCGENGVFYSAFNYILPIVSAAFMIGVIMYGSGLEYGLAVEYNGRQLGIITAEADFETAQRDVMQRISYNEGEENIDLSAKFSLRIISENEQLVTAGQLADKMLEASDEELTKAYGIYIDGNFIGAVRDKDEVQAALDEKLLNYETDGVVKNISYVNKIEYTEGIYLLSSVKDQQETIDMLTSTKERRRVYVAAEGDTPVSVVQKYGMRLDEFNELNPKAEKGIKKGQMLNVIERESYLPIQYVREMESLTFLDYETIEVETSTLNVGVRSVLVKGERGEKVSNIEITYVDGIESSRQVLDSVITKNPVVETIGVGTYSAIAVEVDVALIVFRCGHQYCIFGFYSPENNASG